MSRHTPLGPAPLAFDDDLDQPSSQGFNGLHHSASSLPHQALSLGGLHATSSSMHTGFVAAASTSPLLAGSSGPAAPSSLVLSHSNVYIAGIPHTWSKIHLDEFFSRWGPIYESRILVDKHTLGSRGIAFVRFADIDSARQAIVACNHSVAPGGMERMVVRPATDKHTLHQQHVPANPQAASSPFGGSNVGAIQPPHHSSLNAALVAMGSQPASYSASMYAPQPKHAGQTSIHGRTSVPPPPHVNYAQQPHHQQIHQPESSYSPPPLRGFPSAVSQPSPSHVRSFSQPHTVAHHQHVSRGRHADPGVQLFVFHLPPHLTNEELIPLFSNFGKVLNCAIMRDSATGQSKGFAFITMANHRDAEQAIRYLNGFQIFNKYLKVELKKHSGAVARAREAEQLQQHQRPGSSGFSSQGGSLASSWSQGQLSAPQFSSDPQYYTQTSSNVPAPQSAPYYQPTHQSLGQTTYSPQQRPQQSLDSSVDAAMQQLQILQLQQQQLILQQQQQLQQHQHQQHSAPQSRSPSHASSTSSLSPPFQGQSGNAHLVQQFHSPSHRAAPQPQYNPPQFGSTSPKMGVTTHG